MILSALSVFVVKIKMSITAIITMIVVLGIVWGGLAFFILNARKFEKLKAQDGKE